MHEQRPARVALPPRGSAIHFVGIGGAGMIGLARILLAQGYRISGSDRSDAPALDTLRNLGATVHVGHAAAHVGNAALVVMTAAVRDDNPEVRHAREANIPVAKRAAVLGALANARRCIAVAGTHGKSTTSGMVATILSRLGHAPLFVIGAEVRDLGTSAHDGGGPLGVVEADEYDYSFLHLTPDVALITNVEHDHPDIFPDLTAYVDAFQAFIDHVRDGGVLILNGDDLQARMLSPAGHVRTEAVGSGADSAWRVVSESDGRFTFMHHGAVVSTVSLAIPGRHNAMNAAMAVAASASVGIDPGDALAVAAQFQGVGRRFEHVGEACDIAVIDDYAHHPTEVAATIAAARSRFPGRRLLTVFQPHTYSRATLLAGAFADALSAADIAAVTEIYAARETDPGTIHGSDIAARVRDGRGVYTGTLAETARWLTTALRAGDVVLTLGAGDITTVGPALLQQLRACEESA